MMFTDQAKASFSAMLLKEYGIEIGRDSEILPILYLMHNYEEKMGTTIATGFGFMDTAGTQLTNSSAKLDTLLAEIRDYLKSQQVASEEAKDTPIAGNVSASGDISASDRSNTGRVLGVVPLLLLVIAVVQMLLLVLLLARD